MHTMDIKRNLICRGCLEEVDTIKHLLCKCPALNGIRLSMFGEIYRSWKKGINTMSASILTAYVRNVARLKQEGAPLQIMRIVQ